MPSELAFDGACPGGTLKDGLANEVRRDLRGELLGEYTHGRLDLGRSIQRRRGNAGWTSSRQGRGFWVNEESGESVWDQDHAEEVGANRTFISRTQVLETWLHEVVEAAKSDLIVSLIMSVVLFFEGKR